MTLQLRFLTVLTIWMKNKTKAMLAAHTFSPPRDIDLAVSVWLFVRPYVTNVLGLYLKYYYRFEHDTLGVYKSHLG